jgi:hypothetical protein
MISYAVKKVLFQRFSVFLPSGTRRLMAYYNNYDLFHVPSYATFIKIRSDIVNCLMTVISRLSKIELGQFWDG